MTQPTGFVPVTDFSQEETNAVAGRSTVRTDALDAEFSAIQLTFAETLANLAVIQRDDTGLRDLIVTTESLSANVKALFAGGINPRGTWLTATVYAVKDVVETGTPFVSYVCVVAHTSGVFATDRTAGKWMVLGAEAGTTTITDLVLTTGGITLGTNNTQDLASTANRFRSGYFGTSVFATTSVVTPLVGTDTAAELNFKVNATNAWRITTAFNLAPASGSDGSINIGGVGNRVANVFTTAIDSGSTGALSLKTNNGTTQVTIAHVASTVNRVNLQGSATGSSVLVGSAGTDPDISIGLYTRGGGSITFASDDNTATQFRVVKTAGSTRWIDITGSNGGNPTIGTTAGSLAITPSVVLTAGQISFPATQNASADANTLDDYEEGTWTPSVGGSATYTAQSGMYTKIGRFVKISGDLRINAIGTGSTATVTGLPFTSNAANGGGVVVHNSSGLATTVVSIAGDVVVASTQIIFRSRTAAATADAGNAVFASGSVVLFSGGYTV